MVGVGNNHLYDALEEGARTTLQALRKAGFEEGSGYFGAGASADAAWRPAVLEVAGQTIAFLGCTTIEGAEHFVNYVATETKGGAAGCTAGR